MLKTSSYTLSLSKLEYNDKRNSKSRSHSIIWKEFLNIQHSMIEADTNSIKTYYIVNTKKIIDLPQSSYVTDA